MSGAQVLVLFQNEVVLRTYSVATYGDLKGAVHRDLTGHKGLHRLTFKPNNSLLEIAITDENGDMHLHDGGVFRVYITHKRKVRLCPAEVVTTIEAPDFESFVQQIEHHNGPIERITYEASGPTGQIEFEISEDSFVALQDTLFVAYLRNQEETRGTPPIDVHIPTLGDEPVQLTVKDWEDLLQQVKQLAQTDRIERISYQLGAGEVSLDEAAFEELEAKHRRLFRVHFKETQASEFSVMMPGSGKQRFFATSFSDLFTQVQQFEGRSLEALTYSVKGPHGQTLDVELDDSLFDSVEEITENTLLIPRFRGSSFSSKRHNLVLFDGDHFPTNILASEFADLERQVIDVLAQRDQKLKYIAFSEEGPDGQMKDIRLDEKNFEKNDDRELLFHVFVIDPVQRIVQLPQEEEPARIHASTFAELTEAVEQLLNGQVLKRITFRTGSEPEQDCSEENFNTIPETVVYCAYVAGVDVPVLLPGEDSPRVFTAQTYSDLVKLVERSVKTAVEMFVLQEDESIELADQDFDQQLSQGVWVAVVREPIAITAEMPSGPAKLVVSSYEELLTEIKGMAGEHEISKLTYFVEGPRGQVELTLHESLFDDMRQDPENRLVKVHLSPPPKQFRVKFEEEQEPCWVNARDFVGLQAAVLKQAGGRVVQALQFMAGDQETELTSETYPQLEAQENPIVHVKFAEVDESLWITIFVKFPFEREPRKITGVEFDGLIREIAKNAPSCFSDVEKLTYKTVIKGKPVERVVHEGVLEDIEDPNTIFYAHFKSGAGYQPPMRLVLIEGQEAPHKVRALHYDEFMQHMTLLAGDKEIKSITYELETGDSSRPLQLEESVFYDLDLSTVFTLHLVDAAAEPHGVPVVFGDDEEPHVIPADSYEQLVSLVAKEAASREREVERIVVVVPGPKGHHVEMGDADEDTFQDEMEHVSFKVYFAPKSSCLRLVKFPGHDEPVQIPAATLEDLHGAIRESLPADVLEAATVMYELPAPHGGMVSFELTEEAWEDIAEDESVVFTVSVPAPTTELLVKFPWEAGPKPVEAGTFHELWQNIQILLPPDQDVAALTFGIPNPNGQLVQFPLTELSFGDIDDADTVVTVTTKPSQFVNVRFPPVPVRIGSDFSALLSGIRAKAPLGTTVRRVVISSGGGAQELSEHNYSQLIAGSDILAEF
eukprot:TRINITY_DN4497_c0_g2_i1.p1 TRINITY_DN4497_c0_g2~~TRINITY_DN4497_c0_g2_i1.p1  ORF type:complete len:1170 (+),score=233.68 TRINITY_DN4497_c0_g2_i1:86-3595(+)